MKKILALAICMLTLSFLGCQPSDVAGGNGPEGETFILKAIVKNTSNPAQIEVEVIESDYAYGIYWVHTSETNFLDAEGNSISISDINAGDVVEITYGGQVMMSYPPQIVAYKIKKVK